MESLERYVTATPVDAPAGDAAIRASAPIFAALGDDTRLRIVGRLSADGPTSIARLTVGTGVTRQAVTKHLHVLSEVGLVRGRLCRPRERVGTAAAAAESGATVARRDRERNGIARWAS